MTNNTPLQPENAAGNFKHEVASYRLGKLHYALNLLNAATLDVRETNTAPLLNVREVLETPMSPAAMTQLAEQPLPANETVVDEPQDVAAARANVESVFGESHNYELPT